MSSNLHQSLLVYWLIGATKVGKAAFAPGLDLGRALQLSGD